MDLGLIIFFIILILLSLTIWLYTKSLHNKKAKKIPDDSVQPEMSGFRQSVRNASDMPLSAEELIAVLTAAVQAYAGSNPDCRIRVKSFRRIPQNTPAWNMAGRKEYLSNKL